MSSPEHSVGSLQPGDVIEIGTIHTFTQFENMVARDIDEQVVARLPVIRHLDWAMWISRQSIGDVIRPRNVSGVISNIELEVMDDPLARLIDARQRGWHIGAGAIRAPTNAFAHLINPLYQGYRVIADVGKRAGRNDYGQLQTEIWYYPVPIIQTDRRNSGIIQQIESYGGRSVHRRAATPRLRLREGLIEFSPTHRRIGFSALQAPPRP